MLLKDAIQIYGEEDGYEWGKKVLSNIDDFTDRDIYLFYSAFMWRHATELFDSHIKITDFVQGLKKAWKERKLNCVESPDE